MDSLKVTISNHQKAVKIPTGTRMLIRRCCTAVFQMEGINVPAEVSVTFVDNKEIHRLNLQYRQKDRPTDVLSFPLGEVGQWDKDMETGFYMLGDIVISAEKAVEQADRYGHGLMREIGFLTTHSMLHLLGYDHENGGMEAVKMREKEETVLSMLGYAVSKGQIIHTEE